MLTGEGFMLTSAGQVKQEFGASGNRVIGLFGSISLREVPMARFATGLLIVLCCCFSGCSSSTVDSKVGSEAEAKWAREIAQHFLDASAEQNAEAMRTASTKAFAKEINNPTIEGRPVVFAITSQEVSPNGEQISFKGVLESKSNGKKRSFTLLMEKEDVRWEVASYSQGPQP
jgi:hypothetical protein